MQEGKAFLGTGWSFPPAFSRINNSALLVSGIDDIAESLHIILDTTPGERIMQPKFGCHIRRLVFDILDSAFINEVNDMIRFALLHFEPRVKFINAEVITEDRDGGVIYIRINYTVIITNTRHNIVYPFYILEGTNVSS